MLEITKESIEKATAKARIEKPRVRVIEFRTYAVTNKNGVTYTVKFYKVNGRKFGECDCVATRICYHISSSLPIHLVLSEQMHRQTV
jgi:hypothetical protein